MDENRRGQPMAPPVQHQRSPQAEPNAGFANAPGVETHDGFFLRMDIGGGASRFTDDQVDVEIKGPTVVVGFEIGGAVAENLIVYGRLAGDSIEGPKLRVGSTEVTAKDSAFQLSTFGVGMDYYIMPINMFVGGSVSMGGFTLTFPDGTSVSSDKAKPYVLALEVGEEWWVSDNWGLGIIAQAYTGTIEHTITRGFSLAFSATFN